MARKKDKQESQEQQMSDADIKKLLKEEEAKKREADMKKAEAKMDKKVEKKVSFDVWYAGRQKDIPAHHRKEVIAADFKARKMPGLCTQKEWDDALRMYGVKL